MAKGSKSKKRKSLAFRLLHSETGHHYVVRLGKTSAEKLKDNKIKKYNPVLRQHVEYEVKKIKNAK